MSGLSSITLQMSVRVMDSFGLEKLSISLDTLNLMKLKG